MYIYIYNTLTAYDLIVQVYPSLSMPRKKKKFEKNSAISFCSEFLETDNVEKIKPVSYNLFVYIFFPDC